MASLPEVTGLSAALRATCKPLDQARTLPGVCYTEAAIHTLEQERLFAASWLAMAREEDLPAAGSFVTCTLGRERILVVRAEDATLRAFYNVCRHRGSRLVEEASGTLKGAVVCPYHAWSYRLDGRLRHAPQFDPGEAAGPLALIELPLALWAGFVMVNPAGNAAPFGQAPGALPDWSRFGLERLRRACALDYAVHANWKLVCENYSECYHCPRAHPQLDRLCERSAGGFEAGAGYNGGPMQLRAGVDTLSSSGRSAWPRLDPDAHGDAARLVHYALVYPNLMLGVHPDYLTVHTVWPESASACRVRCEVFVTPEALAQPQFDPAGVVEFWELTNRQDWALCERVQRGAGSRGCVPGPYQASERCVHAFDRWYAQWLAGNMDALRRTGLE
jgi:Rieske 2Fe-2S family protein